jgi:hypothetical protein
VSIIHVIEIRESKEIPRYVAARFLTAFWSTEEGITAGTFRRFHGWKNGGASMIERGRNKIE